MGVHDNIDFDVFPNQSNQVGNKVEVGLVAEEGVVPVQGTIVRDDVIDPLVRLIELDDGHIVMEDEVKGYLNPPQGSHLDRRAQVVFRYDTSRLLEGKIVRDDMAEPWQTVIKLDVGRYVLSTECQYCPLPD